MEVQVVRNSLVVTPDKHQTGKTIEHLCVNDLKLPSNFVRQWLQAGFVHVQKTVADMVTAVKAGQRITLQGGIEEPFGVDLDANPAKFPSSALDVLYEDDHLLVVNKPAGLIIYPGSPEDGWTLAHLVANHYRQQGLTRKVRHVHRLDRDTTGAILYANHAYSARAMDSMLADGRIKRTYLALVHGRFPRPTGTIDAPIGRDRHISGRFRVSPSGKPAVTDYRVVAGQEVINGYVSLVECSLRTGRTHQIRVHLSSSGHPVVGDTLYGAGQGVGSIPYEHGQALHAYRLAFEHPYEGKVVEVEAPLPPTFHHAIEALEMTTPHER